MEKNVTDEQIQQWKEKYSEVYELSAAKEEPENKYAGIDEVPVYTCFCRKPDDKIIAAASASFPNLLKVGEILFRACWLGGDEETRTDPALVRSLGLECVEWLELRMTAKKKR